MLHAAKNGCAVDDRKYANIARSVTAFQQADIPRSTNWWEDEEKPADLGNMSPICDSVGECQENNSLAQTPNLRRTTPPQTFIYTDVDKYFRSSRSSSREELEVTAIECEEARFYHNGVLYNQRKMSAEAKTETRGTIIVQTQQIIQESCPPPEQVKELEQEKPVRGKRKAAKKVSVQQRTSKRCAARKKDEEKDSPDLDVILESLTKMTAYIEQEKGKEQEVLIGGLTREAREKKVERFRAKQRRRREENPVKRKYTGRSHVAIQKPRIRGRFVSREEYLKPVSYTHLTLPTIYSV
eukprot:TRINITY_DN11749_c0_g1_i2.p1 TRINITY_DN11749_c0_g1~~TRINITY_DN11749_c0_g1_i2.p1  ORF type:complete len:297 (-),score=69.20 TRINITY_DN11749_c0_g1_i2:17-907(-)